MAGSYAAIALYPAHLDQETPCTTAPVSHAGVGGKNFTPVWCCVWWPRCERRRSNGWNMRNVRRRGAEFARTKSSTCTRHQGEHASRHPDWRVANCSCSLRWNVIQLQPLPSAPPTFSLSFFRSFCFRWSHAGDCGAMGLIARNGKIFCSCCVCFCEGREDVRGRQRLRKIYEDVKGRLCDQSAPPWCGINTRWSLQSWALHSLTPDTWRSSHHTVHGFLSSHFNMFVGKGMLAFYSVLASINLHIFFCSVGNKQTSCSDRYIFSRLLCSHLHTLPHLQPTHAQTSITYPHACNSSEGNFHWFTINNQGELSAIDYLRRTMEVGHLDPGHSCLRSSLPLSSCDTISALCNINTRREGFRRLVDLLCARAMCVGGGGGVTETVILKKNYLKRWSEWKNDSYSQQMQCEVWLICALRETQKSCVWNRWYLHTPNGRTRMHGSSRTAAGRPQKRRPSLVREGLGEVGSSLAHSDSENRVSRVRISALNMPLCDTWLSVVFSGYSFSSSSSSPLSLSVHTDLWKCDLVVLVTFSIQHRYKDGSPFILPELLKRCLRRILLKSHYLLRQIFPACHCAI